VNNGNNRTHEVGKLEANGLGLFDMSGNIWEWCWDRGGNYTNDAKTDPTGPTAGTGRMVRGGQYDSAVLSTRSVQRGATTIEPSSKGNFRGFRLARP